MADGQEYRFDFTLDYSLESLEQMSEQAIARYELDDQTAYLWWGCPDSGHQTEINSAIQGCRSVSWMLQVNVDESYSEVSEVFITESLDGPLMTCNVHMD